MRIGNLKYLLCGVALSVVSVSISTNSTVSEKLSSDILTVTLPLLFLMTGFLISVHSYFDALEVLPEKLRLSIRAGAPVLDVLTLHNTRDANDMLSSIIGGKTGRKVSVGQNTCVFLGELEQRNFLSDRYEELIVSFVKSGGIWRDVMSPGFRDLGIRIQAKTRAGSGTYRAYVVP